MICCRQQLIRWRDSDEQTLHRAFEYPLEISSMKLQLTLDQLSPSKDFDVPTPPAATISNLSLWRPSSKPRLPRRPMLPQVHGA